MKHTLLIALLGATVTLATPSLSFADNGHKFKNGVNQQQHQANARRDRDRRNNGDKFTAKPPKPHRIVKQIHRDINKKRHYNKSNKHHNKRQQVNKHRNNKHQQVNKHRNDKRQLVNKHRNNNYDYRRNEPSFSISWNLGNSNLEYGNVRHGYNQPVYKQRGGQRIYKRIHRQANRIQNGVESGQLVKREVRKLRREQRHIKNTLASYKRDGRLNRYERSKVNQLLDVASNNIHRKKNNRLTRYNKRHNNNNHNYNYAQF